MILVMAHPIYTSSFGNEYEYNYFLNPHHTLTKLMQCLYKYIVHSTSIDAEASIQFMRIADLQLRSWGILAPLKDWGFHLSFFPNMLRSYMVFVYTEQHLKLPFVSCSPKATECYHVLSLYMSFGLLILKWCGDLW